MGIWFSSVHHDLLKALGVKGRLLHRLTFAAKQNHRDVVFANLATDAVIVVRVTPRIVFRDSDRLGAKRADTLRIAAAGHTARSFRPANLGRAFIELERHRALPLSLPPATACDARGI